MKRTMAYLLALSVLAVAGVLAGCGSTGPAIKITAPTDGSTVSSGNITVSVEVSDFDLVDKLGQANVVGEGHIHYFLDVTPPTTQGQPAVTAAGTYAATAATSYTWPNVTPGNHAVSVELVNNDHTPLDRPVVATVTVTVEAAAPAISITAPENGSVVPIGDVTISLQVSNFNLVDKLSQGSVPGEGHIHYFLDVTPPTTQGQPAVTAAGTYAATAATSYTWSNLAAGTHTLSAQLVNNDHTPLNPPIVATVTVTASAKVGQSVTIDLIAQNIDFNTNLITVPPGAKVTINFDNRDGGIYHNFALYQNSSGTSVIFRGAQIAGPATITYNFTGPSIPGTYYFQCDPHGGAMTGDFVVTDP